MKALLFAFAALVLALCTFTLCTRALCALACIRALRAHCVGSPVRICCAWPSCSHVHVHEGPPVRIFCAWLVWVLMGCSAFVRPAFAKEPTHEGQGSPNICFSARGSGSPAQELEDSGCGELEVLGVGVRIRVRSLGLAGRGGGGIVGGGWGPGARDAERKQ
eukprot:13575266-Alexandrium_andersonii.AAC.1